MFNLQFAKNGKGSIKQNKNVLNQFPNALHAKGLFAAARLSHI